MKHTRNDKASEVFRSENVAVIIDYMKCEAIIARKML